MAEKGWSVEETSVSGEVESEWGAESVKTWTLSQHF